MNAMVIQFANQGEVNIVEESLPDLSPDSVLVGIEKSLISTGTEMTCLDRTFEAGTGWDDWVKYPFRPGYASVGVVQKAGAAVRRVQEGDRVFLRVNHASHAVVPELAVLRIPEGVDSESAAWGALAKIVQNGVRRAEHKLGDIVVVAGLGPLGQLAVRYVRLLGPWRLIAIDLAPSRLALAEAGGASCTLCKPVDECIEGISELTDGWLGDVAYDVTGSARVLAQLLSAVRPLGRMVLLGDTGYPSQQGLSQALVTRGITLAGAHDSNPAPQASVHTPWSHDRITELFFHYLACGDMRVDDLISHRFPATDAPEVYGFLREHRGDSMGVILDWPS